jgi:SAM-dependent methyltransferase
VSPPGGNIARFSGFAGLYDAVRPSPPGTLGALLCAYAQTERPVVVDLGSGSGLSSRWAARWAASVVGIEPNDDMRAVAESQHSDGVTYRRGVSDATGLADAVADVVVAVQAFHWMEPASTLAEVSRILRPGGVLAVADADWPPVAGRPGAERAWRVLERRISTFEERLAAGKVGQALHRRLDPEAAGAPGPADPPVRTPDGACDRGDGVRSWPKRAHLARIAESGHFPFTREVVMHDVIDGGPERFIALMRSQGSYQQLRRSGLSDEELGMGEFEREVAGAFARPDAPPGLVLSWRVRLGVSAAGGP